MARLVSDPGLASRRRGSAASSRVATASAGTHRTGTERHREGRCLGLWALGSGARGHEGHLFGPQCLCVLNEGLGSLSKGRPAITAEESLTSLARVTSPPQTARSRSQGNGAQSQHCLPEAAPGTGRLSQGKSRDLPGLSPARLWPWSWARHWTSRGLGLQVAAHKEGSQADAQGSACCRWAGGCLWPHHYNSCRPSGTLGMA